MIQEIIVISMVAASALFLIYKWLPKKKKGLDKSQGCSSGCAGCSSEKPKKFS